MAESGGRWGACRVALVGVVAAVALSGAALAEGTFDDAAAFEVSQAIGAARAASAVRGAVIAPRAGPSTRLLLLRDRADYLSTAEMIEKETEIVAAEIAAVRVFNEKTEAELAQSRAEIEALAKAREMARKAKQRRLRQQLAAKQRGAEARLDAADLELATTSALREQAVDEGAEVARWREKEEALRMERDRLRRMLERVSELSSGLS